MRRKKLYLVRIGPYSANRSGATSKGYELKLEGRTVSVQWGSVNANRRNFIWAQKPRTDCWVCRTAEEAREKFEFLRQKREDHLYDKLIGRRRIMPQVKTR